MPAAGISGWTLLLTMTRSYGKCRALAPLAADERRLGDVRERLAVVQSTLPTIVSRLVALIASRMAALSSMFVVRLSASMATSNRAWAKPIGCVHCFFVAVV